MTTPILGSGSVGGTPATGRRRPGSPRGPLRDTAEVRHARRRCPVEAARRERPGGLRPGAGRPRRQAARRTTPTAPAVACGRAELAAEHRAGGVPEPDGATGRPCPWPGRPGARRVAAILRPVRAGRDPPPGACWARAARCASRAQRTTFGPGGQRGSRHERAPDGARAAPAVPRRIRPGPAPRWGAGPRPPGRRSRPAGGPRAPGRGAVRERAPGQPPGTPPAGRRPRPRAPPPGPWGSRGRPPPVARPVAPTAPSQRSTHHPA
ncbi:hypothetical protein JOF35_003564 [Streptomyces demainii]|uniref:Basic proline-rich protein n=1 Tax=Streptomyces demainii TaxID=588122 RepID=A0ABT9KUV7_9ACTN|nr:hypothetical protein [Streptomyces demainii]